MSYSEKEFADLIKARYQDGKSAKFPGVLNPTVKTILSHKSVRNFLPDPLPTGALETLMASASSASTSSLLQAWAAIIVDVPKHKDAVATLAGNQDFIRQAPVFFILMVDLYRLARISEKAGIENKAVDKMDMFIMPTLDCGIAGQNIALAAESLGLGVCYVGAVRNNASELCDLLKLPPRMMPVFGLAIGEPDESVPNAIKPRFSADAMFHRNVWNGEKEDEHVAAYDDILGRFYEDLAKLGRGAWGSFMAHHFSTDRLDGRENMRRTLEERGFKLE